MTQVTSGIRSILSNPSAYNITQAVFGAEAGRRDVASRYLQLRPGVRVLDIGCGTAEILPHLPDQVEYWGFDLSEQYIAAAQARFGDRGHFRCADVGQFVGPDELHDMDLVLASGVLHHLDDPESQSLISIAWNALGVEGRLITIDPTYAPGQSRLSRWVVSRDRGQSVRTPEGYRALAAERFAHVEVSIRHNLLRIPFSHCVMVCTK